jgi:hypothetical protein
VGLTDDFKQKLKEAYTTDIHFARVLTMLHQAAAEATKLHEVREAEAMEPAQRDQPTTPAPEPSQQQENKLRGINFVERDNLLYHVDRVDNTERLCIPKSLLPEILKIAHDNNFHGVYHRTYDRIHATMFVRGLAKAVKRYIRYCGQCLQNRIERHPPYGTLEPINTRAEPHDTIAIDLVTGLPASKSGFDALMTATCKFTKRVLLIPGMTNWSAVE